MLCLAALTAACGQSEQIDPALVGAWDIPAPGGRWVLTIDAAGHYAFANEAGGPAPSHSGQLIAHDGEWVMTATTMALEDRGSYELGDDGLELSGNLGSLRWTPSATPAASDTSVAATAAPQPPTAQPIAPQQSTPAEPPRASAQSAASAGAAVPDTIDPCLLVTADEATNAIGAAVTTDRTTPQPRTQNNCLYRAGTGGSTLSVRSFNGGGLDTAGYLDRGLKQGGQRLAGIGDNAYFTYRDATGLTSVDFIIGAATVQVLVSGVARAQAEPAVIALATQAANRLTSSAAAFQVPGLERFAGTWLVTTQGESASSGYPNIVISLTRDGTLRLQTVAGLSGTMLLTGTSWRLEDGINQTPPTGQYRLRGDRLTLTGPIVAAELTRVACGKSPSTVKPPYELTRDAEALLTGRSLSLLRLQEGGTDPFDARLAGLWEGEGTINSKTTQVLAAFDKSGRSVIAVYPTVTGRLRASDGNYQLSLSGEPDSAGTYSFPGGTSDGLIYVEEGAKTLVWAPYDPNRRPPPYATPIVGHCN